MHLKNMIIRYIFFLILLNVIFVFNALENEDYFDKELNSARDILIKTESIKDPEVAEKNFADAKDIVKYIIYKYTFFFFFLIFF